MVAPSARIIVELAVKITRIETGEARAVLAVAFAREAMADETGRCGAGVTATEGNRLAGGTEAITVGRRVAPHQRDQKQKGKGAHLAGTNFGAMWFRPCALRK